MERLKPHIVRSLANAELYCMALSHLYADPNFHNLNHWGIIQALARKGICVAEPPDCALTETMLIQTNPLKMVRKILLRYKPHRPPMWTVFQMCCLIWKWGFIGQIWRHFELLLLNVEVTEGPQVMITTLESVLSRLSL